MKNRLIAIALLITLFSCTKYNYDDTGLANGKFDGTMYEYLSGDSYNWDTIRKIIDRSGLKPIFEGKDNNYKNGITFFGPTNHTLRVWMSAYSFEYDEWGTPIKLSYNSVDEIPVDVCQSIVTRHIVKGVYLRDDIPRGKVTIKNDTEEGDEAEDENQNELPTGGIDFNLGTPYPLRVYSYKLPHQGIPEAGPVVLFLVSHNTKSTVDIASTNIETNTGVIHSLSYSYRITQL